MRTTQETVKANTTTQASEKAKSNVRLGKYALNMRITISTVFCCWQALQLLFLCQHNMEALDAGSKLRHLRLALFHFHGLSVAIRFSIGAVVVLRICRQSADPVQYYTDQVVAEFLPCSLCDIERSRIRAHNHEHSVAVIRNQGGVRNRRRRRRIDDDPVKQRLKTVQQGVHSSVRNEFRRIFVLTARRYQKEVIHGTALDYRELVCFGAQVIGKSGARFGAEC